MYLHIIVLVIVVVAVLPAHVFGVFLDETLFPSGVFVVPASLSQDNCNCTAPFKLTWNGLIDGSSTYNISYSINDLPEHFSPSCVTDTCDAELPLTSGAKYSSISIEANHTSLSEPVSVSVADFKTRPCVQTATLEYTSCETVNASWEDVLNLKYKMISLPNIGSIPNGIRVNSLVVTVADPAQAYSFLIETAALDADDNTIKFSGNSGGICDSLYAEISPPAECSATGLDLVANVTCTESVLTWKRPTLATDVSFNVTATSSASFENVFVGSNLTYTFDTLKPDTAYTMAVIMNLESGRFISANSSVRTLGKPGSVENFTHSNVTTSSVSFTWDNVPLSCDDCTRHYKLLYVNEGTNEVEPACNSDLCQYTVSVSSGTQVSDVSIAAITTCGSVSVNGNATALIVDIDIPVEILSIEPIAGISNPFTSFLVTFSARITVNSGFIISVTNNYRDVSIEHLNASVEVYNDDLRTWKISLNDDFILQQNELSKNFPKEILFNVADNSIGTSVVSVLPLSDPIRIITKPSFNDTALNGGSFVLASERNLIPGIDDANGTYVSYLWNNSAAFHTAAFYSNIVGVVVINVTCGTDVILCQWEWKSGSSPWNEFTSERTILNNTDLVRLVIQNENYIVSESFPSIQFFLWDGTESVVSGEFSTFHSVSANNATGEATFYRRKPVMVTSGSIYNISAEENKFLAFTVLSLIDTLGVSISDDDTPSIESNQFSIVIKNTFVADQDMGSWKYQLTGVASSDNAIDFPIDQAVLLPSEASVFFAASENMNRLWGPPPNLTFVAYDGTSNSSAGPLSVSSVFHVSEQEVVLQWQVMEVNSRPTFQRNFTLPDLGRNVTDDVNRGRDLTQLFHDIGAMDIEQEHSDIEDNVENLSMLIVQRSLNDNGVWQIRSNDSDTWTPMVECSVISDHVIRFSITNSSASNYTNFFSFRIWDKSDCGDQSCFQSVCDAENVSSSFSELGVISQNVIPVNFRPILSKQFEFKLVPAIEEGSKWMSEGIRVDNFLKLPVDDRIIDAVNDEDSPVDFGIAITDIVGNAGLWEYRSTDGSDWNTILAESGRVFLLNNDDFIRFSANIDDPVAVVDLVFRVWDMYQGRVDLNINRRVDMDESNSSPYTSNSVIVSLDIISVNDGPTAFKTGDIANLTFVEAQNPMQDSLFVEINGLAFSDPENHNLTQVKIGIEPDDVELDQDDLKCLNSSYEMLSCEHSYRGSFVIFKGNAPAEVFQNYVTEGLIYVNHNTRNPIGKLKHVSVLFMQDVSGKPVDASGFDVVGIVNIEVVPINDPPVIIFQIPNRVINVQNTVAAFLFSGFITVDDVDSNIQITLKVMADASSDGMDIFDCGNLVANCVDGEGTLVLSSIPAREADSHLQQVSYEYQGSDLGNRTLVMIIHDEVTSGTNSDFKMEFTINIQKAPSSSLTWLVGPVIGIIAVMGVVSFFVMKKHSDRKDSKHGNLGDIETVEMSQNGSSFVAGVPAPDQYTHQSLMQSRPLSIAELSRIVSNPDALRNLSREFGSVDTNMLHISQMPVNTSTKNRYANVLPNPKTRVILSTINNIPNTDYINANFVRGHSLKKAYIATQGPMEGNDFKESTLEDFWRMVWEHNVAVIVCTTGLVEGGKLKCSRYWPKSPGADPDIYGYMRVAMVGVDRLGCYTITDLIVTNSVTNQSRNVRHFWFNDWPDHGVPKTTASIIEFLHDVREYKKLTNGPLCVHCSAGIGRTGTFIACDLGMQAIDERRNVDMLQTLGNLRQDRGGMIQTEAQYEFCHLVLADYPKSMDK